MVLRMVLLCREAELLPRSAWTKAERERAAQASLGPVRARGRRHRGPREKVKIRALSWRPLPSPQQESYSASLLLPQLFHDWLILPTKSFPKL